MKIDCKACNKEKSMEQSKVYKHSPLVVIVGWIIAIPSLLGVAICALFFLIGASSVSTNSAGNAVAGISVVFGLMSFVSGLLGYLLISKKKVYKCNICGFIMDRAD